MNDPRTIEDLTIRKNYLLQNLVAHSIAECNLAKEIADYEGQIAARYVKAGEKEKALINFISEASLLADAKLGNDAIQKYEELLDFIRNSNINIPALVQFIKNQIKMIVSNRMY